MSGKLIVPTSSAPPPADGEGSAPPHPPDEAASRTPVITQNEQRSRPIVDLHTDGHCARLIRSLFDLFSADRRALQRHWCFIGVIPAGRRRDGRAERPPSARRPDVDSPARLSARPVGGRSDAGVLRPNAGTTRR